MIFRRKKKKQKRPLTSLEKEQKFIKISTRICLILVFTFAIGYGVADTANKFSTSEVQLSQDFIKLCEQVNTGELIYAPIDNDYYDGLVTKINASELDIMDDDKLSYEKYNKEAITLNSDLILNNQELALMYSYIFMFNPDTYDIIIQQLIIDTYDKGYSIEIISTMDFYLLFSSKADANYSSNELKSLPKKVFATNKVVVENNTFAYSNVKFNNLTDEESLSIAKLINSVNNVNLNEYVPNLILTFVNNLSQKTGSLFSFEDSCVKFKV